MFLKTRFFIFIVLILLIFAVLTYQGSRGSSFNTPSLAFFNYPLKILEQGIFVTVKGIKDFFRNYIPGVSKKIENRKFVDQDENQYLETKYENERLRALLDLKSQRTDYVTSAEVFARDPTNWFQILWINKGRDGGVSKNMTAVTPSGVVGRILRVFKDSATIILLTDVNSSVAVRLQASRVEGILEGRGDNRCYLKYVPQDVDVVIGDGVITSGLDGIYPEGLLTGYVSDVRKGDREFFQVIEVTPAQALDAVEEVAVLKR